MRRPCWRVGSRRAAEGGGGGPAGPARRGTIVSMHSVHSAAPAPPPGPARPGPARPPLPPAARPRCPRPPGYSRSGSRSRGRSIGVAGFVGRTPVRHRGVRAANGRTRLTVIPRSPPAPLAPAFPNKSPTGGCTASTGGRSAAHLIATRRERPRVRAAPRSARAPGEWWSRRAAASGAPSLRPFRRVTVAVSRRVQVRGARVRGCVRHAARARPRSAKQERLPVSAPSSRRCPARFSRGPAVANAEASTVANAGRPR